jgi:hypothetical protein
MISPDLRLRIAHCGAFSPQSALEGNMWWTMDIMVQDIVVDSQKVKKKLSPTFDSAENPCLPRNLGGALLATAQGATTSPP